MDWGNVTAEDLIDALREVDWSSPPRPLTEFFSRFTIPRSSSKWNSRLKCNLYYRSDGALLPRACLVRVWRSGAERAGSCDGKSCGSGAFARAVENALARSEREGTGRWRIKLPKIFLWIYKPRMANCNFIDGLRFIYLLLFCSYRTNYFLMIIFILGLGFLRKPLAIVATVLTGLSLAFLNDSFAVTFNEKVTRTVRQFSPHLAAKMRPPITPVIRGRPSAKRTIHICGWPRWTFVLIFSAASCILWFTSYSLLTVLWAFVIGLLATILHASFRTPNLKARLNTFREEFRAVWRNYSEL